MRNYVIEDWLKNEDFPPSPGGPPQPPVPEQGLAGQNPQDMAAPAPQPPANPGQEPNVANSGQQEPQDISQDPPAPDMPEEKPGVEDFEVWRKQYAVESIKGDTQKLVDLLSMVRDKDGLGPAQRKFVEDNWNIQLVRQNSNVDKASKDIRRNIKAQLDRNNPATTVVSHMVSVLQTVPTLNNIFIKLRNYGGLKGDLHRKFIGALVGGIQLGSGGNSGDLVYNEKDYSIEISTRMNSEWGEVLLGNWCLREDDPDRFLSEPEKKRLDDGSPQEKDVLRRRVILESIAKQYETRSFIINVVDQDGMIYTLGWDIAGSLRAAYSEGKIVVKTKLSENSEAMISDEGRITPYMDVDILFTKETGQQGEDGMPETEDLSFLQKRNGMLFLTADLKTIQEAASSMQGIVLKETPYTGNPSDLKVLARCTYSAHDLLMRVC